MNKADIRRNVLDTVRCVAPGGEVSHIAPDRPLRPQLKFDSMDWLNIIEGFYERLGVDVPEADYPQLETLDDIVVYFSNRLGHKAG
jgi:acyl carrier protein